MSDDREQRDAAPCTAASPEPQPVRRTGSDPAGGVDRRTFLAGATAAAAAGLGACGEKKRSPAERREPGQVPEPVRRVSPPPVPRGVAGRGRVFEVRHDHAVDAKGQPARAPVEAMVDHLMAELTGRSKPTDAWATLFKPDDVVGIKPNARGGAWCSPSAALMDTLVARLTAVGVKPQNILVWELDHFTEHPLYAHLRKGPIQTKVDRDWGFHHEVHRLSTGKPVRFNLAVHRATAIINVAAFKDHGRAGVTGALKNLSFGSIDNPREHHANCCNPATGEIYALAPLREKVRLTLADAFRLIYDRGPTGLRSRAFNLPGNRLYATTDPVALDRICWEVLDRIRQDKGLDPLMKRDTGGGRLGRPYHVLHASKIGLGEAERAKISLTSKTLG